MSAFDSGRGIGLKIAGIAGVLAVLAGGCAAAYAFSDTVKNQMKLAFSEPQDYFEWVYEKNTTDLAERCGTGYQQSIGRRNDGETDCVELRLEPSEEIRDFLIDEIFYDELDENEQELADVIRSTESLALKMDTVTRGNAVSAGITLMRNDGAVTSADAASDLDAAMFYARVPDLNERWISMDLAAFSEELLDGQGSLRRTGDLPDAQEIADMVKRYGMMFVQDVNDVTVEKKQPVQISGVSTEYTAMTAELTADQFLNTVQTMLDAASTDSTLQKLMGDDVSFRSAMMDASDSIRTLRSYDLNGGDTVKMITYVDGMGVIRGHYITVGSNFAYFGALGMEKDHLAGELKLSVMGKKILGGKLDATRDGDVISGTASCTAASGYGDDVTINFSFDDVEIVDAEQGYFNGVLKLTASEEEFPTIALTFSSDGSNQTVSYPLEIEDMSVGTLKLIYAREAGGTVSVPDGAGAFAVDPESSYDIAWEDYVSETELRAYLTDVMQKLGFSESAANDAIVIADSFY